MSKMNTRIRKNATRKIAQIFETGVYAESYSDWNQYTGEALDVAEFKKHFYERDRKAEIFEDEDRFTFRYHSRSWVYVYKPLITADSPEELMGKEIVEEYGRAELRKIVKLENGKFALVRNKKIAEILSEGSVTETHYLYSGVWQSEFYVKVTLNTDAKASNSEEL